MTTEGIEKHLMDWVKNHKERNSVSVIVSKILANISRTNYQLTQEQIETVKIDIEDIASDFRCNVNRMTGESNRNCIILSTFIITCGRENPRSIQVV